MRVPRRPLFAIALAAGLIAGACRTAVPVVDTGEPLPEVNGTIAGTVRGPEGTAPAVGRTVRAVSLGTGRVFHVETSAEGAYTMKVPPGEYRLEVILLEGERIVEGPDDTDVNPSDVDAGRDFVIATGGTPDA